MALQNSTWAIDKLAFKQWLEFHDKTLFTGFALEPSIKLLIFLALLDSKEYCSYAELNKIFREKKIITGVIPHNTMRTSVLSLGKSLTKYKNFYELKSLRGSFCLIKRENIAYQQSPFTLLLDNSIFKAESIAYELVEKARLPFHALYLLENSARWWEIFSHNEAQIRIQYEICAWERLGIKNRLLNNAEDVVSIVSLAPGEGLAEIELLKKILSENKEKKIHYLAVDLSQRLLRAHLNLLKEALEPVINEGRLICVGVLEDIFSDLRSALNRARESLVQESKINKETDFIPVKSSLLVTYLGNCLGNYYPDQEMEIFSIIHSVFNNRPLEVLVGVSVMRAHPDEYKRNWDSFLLQTPKHLLETHKLLESSRCSTSSFLPEFNLPLSGESERCPAVIPENYIVRHQIEGHIYRFYYKLEYELSLSSHVGENILSLPRGTLILLYNIVKYNMQTLINGIAKTGLYSIKYDPSYHQMIDTPNGKREYAVFSAYINSSMEL